MKSSESVTPTPAQNRIIEQALALHQSGRLEQAATIYKNLLKSLPANTTLLNYLGTLLFQQGKLDEAARLLRKSLQIDTNQSYALVMHGLVLQGLNRPVEALVSYDLAVALNADDVVAQVNRGNALNDLKRYPEALLSYDKVIALSPSMAQAHANRGLVLQALGRPAEALNCYERAIQLEPGYAEAYSHRGNALQELKRPVEALKSYDHAIALNPGLAEAYANRGAVLHFLKRNSDALSCYERAISLNPQDISSLTNRGVTLHCLKRYLEALASHDKAIALHPGYAQAHSNRGNTLKDLNRLEEAVASYERALNLDPQDAETYCNLGNTHKELKRLDQALVSYEQAITINAVCAEALWNKALIYILQGDYQQGWPLYEWGWQCGQRQSPVTFTKPVWLGAQPLINKTILIYPEQGLGDYIQCLRYLLLVEKLAGQVLVLLPAALMAVAKTLQGRFTLIEMGQELPEFDYCCPVMSLPLALKSTLDTIPAQIPYLYADEDRQQQWRQRLGMSSRPRVGLVWSGSTTHQNDHRRSIPLKQLSAIFDSGFELHCLQKEIRVEDASVMAENQQISCYQEFLHDFADTAALIAEMDLVISVDTSVAHLAGALGKPVWILLPYAPDYRWLLERSDCPWYPTAKLFRQTQPGDWDGVLSEVVAALKISWITQQQRIQRGFHAIGRAPNEKCGCNRF